METQKLFLPSVQSEASRACLILHELMRQFFFRSESSEKFALLNGNSQSRSQITLLKNNIA